MIILDCEQLDDVWFAGRSGIPTASHFDKIVTTKGEPSKQQKAYLYQLAGERITGQKVETYQSPAMKRGVEMEAEAVALYELVEDVETRAVGICYPDDEKKYSCSPDRLIQENGGLEVKCPLLHTHISYLLRGKLPTDYFAQIQGSLLVTGREYWDFISYYPEVKPLILRVYRNEDFIKKLHAELQKFCMELDKTVKKLKEL